MYNFTVNATCGVIQKIANLYNVSFIEENSVFKAWKISIDEHNFHEYRLEKYGNDYHLFCIDEDWKCVFWFDNNDICIEEAIYNGKKLKAASRLKIFEYITMRIWGLKQVGKIE